MADDILKNIPLPADLPENWTSQQTVAPTGAEVGLDEQHGYNYLMKQVNNAQKAAAALNEGKLGLHGTADNSAKWGDYERRFNEVTGSTLVLVETDGKYVDLRPAESIGLTAFAASGVNYVRFNEGTQICWDRVTPANVITSTEKYVLFPVPFAGNAKVLTCSNANMGGTPVQVGWESATGFTIGGGWNNIGAGSGATSWIAIGRWK
jgi:hypothetical protein